MSTKPVTDFTTDFDHTDEAWVADPYPIWDDLRERCPVAHTDRYGGAWLPTRHADVAAVAADHDHFTSRSIIVTEGRPGELAPPAPIGIAPPISSDPPFHQLARRLLLPAFSPKAVAQLEGFTRNLCNRLLDEMGDVDHIDGSVDYAEHIPVGVIAKMLGFPPEDGDTFRSFVHLILEEVDLPFEERIAKFGPVEEYVTAQVEDHLANPRDDLTTYLLNAEIAGQPLEARHVFGTAVLLLGAGIDTTWSAIGASLWHLAQHDEDRRRLATADEFRVPARDAPVVEDDVGRRIPPDEGLVFRDLEGCAGGWDEPKGRHEVPPRRRVRLGF